MPDDERPVDHDPAGPDDDRDPERIEALQDLPRLAEPSRLLEERTVRALRGRGLLRPAPSRPLVAVTPWRAAAALAACLVLFVGGFALGRLQAARSPGGRDGVRLVERQSSAYVEALGSLAQHAAGAGPEAAARAHLVARTTLAAAAEQLVRLAPDDPLATRLLQALETTSGVAPDSSAVAARRVVWF
jgi:hypothetical protein